MHKYQFYLSMFTMHMQFMHHPYLQWGYATGNTFNIIQKVNQIKTHNIFVVPLNIKSICYRQEMQDKFHIPLISQLNTNKYIIFRTLHLFCRNTKQLTSFEMCCYHVIIQ